MLSASNASGEIRQEIMSEHPKDVTAKFQHAIAWQTALAINGEYWGSTNRAKATVFAFNLRQRQQLSKSKKQMLTGAWHSKVCIFTSQSMELLSIGFQQSNQSQ